MSNVLGLRALHSRSLLSCAGVDRPIDCVKRALWTCSSRQGTRRSSCSTNSSPHSLISNASTKIPRGTCSITSTYRRTFNSSTWLRARAREASLKPRDSSLKRQPSFSPFKNRTKSDPPKKVRALTWQDYGEEEGMRIPGGSLRDADITRLFGDEVDTETGNRILRRLQWRRESGCLADKGVSFADYPDIDRSLLLNALEYLRQTKEIDEQAAADGWTRMLEKQFTDETYKRGLKLGLFKKDSSEEDPSKEDAAPYVPINHFASDGQPHGFSVLDSIQRERQAKEKELEAKELAEIEAYQKTQASPQATKTPQERALVLRDARLSKVKAKETLQISQNKAYREEMMKKAFVTGDIDPSATQSGPNPNSRSYYVHILPSTLFFVVSIAACYYFASTYNPPPAAARIFPDIPPAMATVLAIFSINAVILALWRVPRMWALMNRTLIVLPAFPKPIGILGSIFSHQGFKHFASNMLFLMLLGPRLHDLIGRGDFLSLYVGAGVFGGWFSFLAMVWFKQWQVFSMGASAAVYGIVGALCAVENSSHIRILWFENAEVPMSSYQLLGLLMVWEMVSMITSRKFAEVNHLSHIAGALWGAVYGWVLRKRYEERAEEVERGTAGPPMVLREVISDVGDVKGGSKDREGSLSETAK